MSTSEIISMYKDRPPKVVELQSEVSKKTMFIFLVCQEI